MKSKISYFILIFSLALTHSICFSLSEQIDESVVTDSQEIEGTSKKVEKIDNAKISQPEKLNKIESSQPENQNKEIVSPWDGILQMLFGLSVVVTVIYGLLILAKRFGVTKYQASEAMKIKSYLSLSPKEKLMLIEVGEEQVLIGVAPGYVAHVKTLDKPVVKETTGSVPAVFSEKFKSLLVKEKNNSDHETSN